MTIKYFEVSPMWYGIISPGQIDSTNENYVKHNDSTVTIHERYEDHWGGEGEHEVTYNREFADVRNELLEQHKKNVAELQQQIAVLEQSENYEQYCNNMKKI